MSFSSKVKEEICRNTDLDKKEAFGYTFRHNEVSGTLSFASNRQINFRITTENAAIARLVFKLLKKYFNIHTRLMVKK